MSGIKAPIQDVLARLTTLQVRNGDGKTVNLYARIWNGQVREDRKGEHYSFQKPAAFVEIYNGAEYMEIGGGYASADLGWRIHLVHEFYNADTTFEQDLAVFDLRDKIITLLEQFQPTGCSSLMKVSEEQDYDHDNLYHYIIGFTSNFIDSKGSGDDQGKYIDKAPPTNVDITGVVEVPTIAAYVADSSYFKVPQS